MGHDLLQDFNFIYDQAIAWGEMDSMGHVNNAMYFRYFETARIEYVTKAVDFGWRDGSAIGPILASVNCRFRFPLSYPDTISTGIKIVEMGEDRMKMLHRIVSHTHNVVAAEGIGVLVCYDYASQQKVALPADVRERIAALDHPAAFSY